MRLVGRRRSITCAIAFMPQRVPMGRWGWACAPRAECLSRVTNERVEQDSAERKEKRLSFIRSAEPSFFRERPEESLQRLADHAQQASEPAVCEAA